MKRLLVSTLALSLTVSAGTASAESYGYNGQPSNQRHGQTSGSQYDYARVIRVDPVFDSRSGYGTSGYSQASGQRCYEDQTYVRGGDVYNDGYRNDGYRRDDGYYDQYGAYRRNTGGTQTGATVATVVGGLVGAVIGSKVGGGSARYATSAVGTMVGGMAGKQIYEQSQRQRDRTGTVRVCDPVPVDGRSYPTGDRAVDAYDVTYEYAGRQYTSRTNYHPGDRIRVRVDVRAE